METFLGALDRPPRGQTLKMKVARLFKAFEAALVMRHAAALGRVTEPPRSGVVCTAAVEGDDDGPESGVA